MRCRIGKTAPSREALFWHFPGYLGAGQNAWRTTPAGAIRASDWKLQEFFEDGRTELYNLKDDLSEKNNLAAKLTEKAKELTDKLHAWRAAVKASMSDCTSRSSASSPSAASSTS